MSEELDDYTKLCLQMLRQGYLDINSTNEKVKNAAVEFFEDPDTSDPISYRLNLPQVKTWGF